MGLGRGLNSLLGGDAFEDESESPSRNNFVEKSLAEKSLIDKNRIAQEILPPIPTLNKTNAPAPTPAPTPAQEQKVSAPLEPKVPEHLRVWNVRIDKVVGNKEQPRKIFNEAELESLSISIKEQGILQPITVRKLSNETFEIIAGERRWRAAQKAGLEEVPVLIKEVDNSTALELALIENIQREDLNPIEEAEAYFHLIKKYKMTQQQLSEKIGKERATVANVLRLLNLSPEVRKMVANNEISLGQAKALMALTDPKKQKSLALKARDHQLSVRALEKQVAKIRDNNSLEVKEEDIIKDNSVETLKVELQRLLGTKVSIDYNQGKGKISISFYGDDELNQLVDKLRESWKK